MRGLVFTCLLLAVLGGCDGGARIDVRVPRQDGSVPPLEADAGPTCEGDERRTGLVFYGTREPTAMPLRPGQLLAIGTWNGCTGTFITDEWVLTAAHCRIRVGASFCVGTDPANANVCFQAAEVRNHPSLDMSLVRMTQPASSRMPDLEPIPILTERLDPSWIGRTAEAAGYGRRQDGTSGIRELTAQPIVDITREYVVIDGQGVRGLCFGDSGGPVMGLASDSTVRVLGALSYGDESCVGRDNFARTDVALEWIESFTGPTPVAGGACGRVTPEGDCTGDTAIWCRDGTLASERCGGDTRCGWDVAAAGYRCIRGVDPCDGLTAVGECRGTVATWCEGGVLRSRDCAACGEVCGQVAEIGGVYCQPDPCDGVDYLGECRGNVAVWCDDGALQMRDCGSWATCGYVDDTIGYFCIRD